MNTMGWLCVLALAASQGACGGCDARNGRAARAEIEEMSDAEISALLATIDDGEIRVAEAVRAKMSGDANQFADEMIRVHTAAKTDQAAMQNAQGLSLRSSDVTRVLEQQASEAIAQLGRIDAPDSAYVENQVQMHHEALVLIDCVMMPNVQNDALRARIRDVVRPTVERHWQQARGMQGQAAAVDRGIDCARACMPKQGGGLLGDELRTAVCD